MIPAVQDPRTIGEVEVQHEGALVEGTRIPPPSKKEETLTELGCRDSIKIPERLICVSNLDFCDASPSDAMGSSFVCALNLCSMYELH